ncbi:MAG: metal-dependent transcriptional regulator [Chloroflexota bacterium]|nr:metal-dependent transcriptional regulator [Chloroflexota bacterium]
MPELVPSQSEQDYLKAIYHLTYGEAKEQTGPTAMAEWLGFSCASATNMVKKLAERGLVTHSPYHGVALTATGEKVALEVLRHHRLLETYLSERLGVPWEQVHAEADRLEHALSEDLEARLDAALGYPTTDPHGAPIPTKEGIIIAPPTQRLWHVAPGSTVVVVEVADEDAALLTYVANLGLVPGATVEVLTKAPFGGPLHIRVGGGEYALGETVMHAVSVGVPNPLPPAPVGKGRNHEEEGTT